MSNVFELQNGIFWHFGKVEIRPSALGVCHLQLGKDIFSKIQLFFDELFCQCYVMLLLVLLFYTFLLQRLSMSSCKPSYTKMAFKHNTIFSRLIVPYYYVALKVLLKWNTNYQVAGQWLWLSWLSGRFRHQRSAVQIQSLALFYMEHLFTVNCVEKTKIKKKRPGMAYF